MRRKRDIERVDVGEPFAGIDRTTAPKPDLKAEPATLSRAMLAEMTDNLERLQERRRPVILPPCPICGAPVVCTDEGMFEWETDKPHVCQLDSEPEPE